MTSVRLTHIGGTFRLLPIGAEVDIAA